MGKMTYELTFETNTIIQKLYHCYSIYALIILTFIWFSSSQSSFACLWKLTLTWWIVSHLIPSLWSFIITLICATAMSCISITLHRSLHERGGNTSMSSRMLWYQYKKMTITISHGTHSALLVLCEGNQLVTTVSTFGVVVLQWQRFVTENVTDTVSWNILVRNDACFYL